MLEQQLDAPHTVLLRIALCRPPEVMGKATEACLAMAVEAILAAIIARQGAVLWFHLGSPLCVWVSVVQSWIEHLDAVGSIVQRAAASAVHVVQLVAVRLGLLLSNALEQNPQHRVIGPPRRHVDGCHARRTVW